MVLFSIIGDLFVDTLSGWVKTLGIHRPDLSAFIYISWRGARAYGAPHGGRLLPGARQTDAYIRDVAASTTSAATCTDQIAKAQKMLARGCHSQSRPFMFSRPRPSAIWLTSQAARRRAATPASLLLAAREAVAAPTSAGTRRAAVSAGGQPEALDERVPEAEQHRATVMSTPNTTRMRAQGEAAPRRERRRVKPLRSDCRRAASARWLRSSRRSALHRPRRPCNQPTRWARSGGWSRCIVSDETVDVTLEPIAASVTGGPASFAGFI